MKVGILQTGHAPEQVLGSLGDYDHMFTRLLEPRGFECQNWAVVDGEFPNGPDAADGWLVTGSKHGAYEDHDWIPPLEDLIRSIKDSGRPMVGICFGHQIIAQALGGQVVKYDGGWAIGRHTYTYNGREIAVNAWHQDQVVALPPGAQVSASSDFCANAGLVYGDQIWTIQPHPEFGPEMVEALATHRAPGVVAPDRIEQALQDLNKPTDRMEIMDDIAAFLKKGGVA